MKRFRTWVVILSIIILIIFFSIYAFHLNRDNDNRVSIGYSGGPLFGLLYVAEQNVDWTSEYSLARLPTSSDVGYALLSGDIDAGFVEISRIPAFKSIEGFDQLIAVGEISYPYGASVIVREGLNLRLSELNGHKIGVSSSHCKLVEALEFDVERLGIDLSESEYIILPFEDMIPALEAGVVDAIVTQSVYAAVAGDQGHTLLYQNWDVVPGDECCPAIVDQVQYILFARVDSPQAVLLLSQSLLNIQEEVDVAIQRQRISEVTSISLSVLNRLPVASFGIADHNLVNILTSHAHLDDDHDHYDEEHDD